MKIKLLCMAPAGELMFVQQDGHVFHVRYGTHRFYRSTTTVTEDDAILAVERYGWRQVDQWFDDWNALNDYRIRVASGVMAWFPDVPIEDYDRSRLDVVIAQATGAGLQNRAQARSMLWLVLERSEVLHADLEYRHRVINALRQLYDDQPVEDSTKHRCAHPEFANGASWWTCPECQALWAGVSWPAEYPAGRWSRRWMKVV